MRIVVVEDEPRTRAGIVQLIKKINDNYEVVGEAEMGRAALNSLNKRSPNWLLWIFKCLA